MTPIEREQVAVVTRMALAEVMPRFDPAMIRVGHHPVDGRPTLQRSHAIPFALGYRAKLLGLMAVRGPLQLTICRDHVTINDPVEWDRCAKVTVRDALIGRTCGTGISCGEQVAP